MAEERIDRLIRAYMADLAAEVDGTEYGQKCREEFEALRQALATGEPVALDRFGIPSVKAGKEAQIEALRLMLSVAETEPRQSKTPKQLTLFGGHG